MKSEGQEGQKESAVPPRLMSIEHIETSFFQCSKQRVVRLTPLSQICHKI
jgi:hypothetical protein